MKNVFLLVALTVCCYVSQAQPQSTANKVGYANLEYIIAQLPETKKIETDLKTSQAQFKNEIELKSEKLRKQYADFNANMNTLADTVRVNKQRELEQAVADLEKFQQDAQLTLQNKQKLFMAPVQLKVNRAISEVARENGFSVILTQQIGGYRVLLYNNEQVNVSDLVLQKFDVTPVAK